MAARSIITLPSSGWRGDSPHRSLGETAILAFRRTVKSKASQRSARVTLTIFRKHRET